MEGPGFRGGCQYFRLCYGDITDPWRSFVSSVLALRKRCVRSVPTSPSIRWNNAKRQQRCCQREQALMVRQRCSSGSTPPSKGNMPPRGQDIPAGVTCSRKRQRRSSANNDTQRCRRKAVWVSGLTFGVALAFIVVPRPAMSMRIPRPWSRESVCERAVDPEWPFVYTKYREQKVCVRNACALNNITYSCSRTLEETEGAQTCNEVSTMVLCTYSYVCVPLLRCRLLCTQHVDSDV